MQVNLLQRQQERSEGRLAGHITNKIHEVQLQVSSAQEEMRVQDERLERLEQMLNGSIEGHRRLEMQVNRLQQQQEQSEGRLAGHVTDKSDEVQLQHSRAQEEIRMHDERQLPCNSCKNTTAMLTEIEGVCVSVASNVNNSKELMTEEFQQQLLAAVNQTCMTSAEQSLQQHNKAIQGMLSCI